MQDVFPVVRPRLVEKNDTDEGSCVEPKTQHVVGIEEFSFGLKRKALPPLRAWPHGPGLEGVGIEAEGSGDNVEHGLPAVILESFDRLRALVLHPRFLRRHQILRERSQDESHGKCTENEDGQDQFQQRWSHCSDTRTHTFLGLVHHHRLEVSRAGLRFEDKDSSFGGPTVV